MNTDEIIYCAAHWPYKNSGDDLPEDQVKLAIETFVPEEEQENVFKKHPDDQNIIARRLLYRQASYKRALHHNYRVLGEFGDFAVVVDSDTSENGGLTLFKRYGFDDDFSAALIKDSILKNSHANGSCLAHRRLDDYTILFLSGYEAETSPVGNGDYFIGILWCPLTLEQKYQDEGTPVALTRG